MMQRIQNATTTQAAQRQATILVQLRKARPHPKLFPEEMIWLGKHWVKLPMI